jgi:hypothetical protein
MARRCDVCGEEACFVHCVYCGVDCEQYEPEHAVDCPASTGVYVVEYEACHSPCEHCGKRPDPSIRCSGCECVLALGDHYTLRPIDDIAGISCYEPVCLGCAASEAVA